MQFTDTVVVCSQYNTSLTWPQLCIQMTSLRLAFWSFVRSTVLYQHGICGVRHPCYEHRGWTPRQEVTRDMKFTHHEGHFKIHLSSFIQEGALRNCFPYTWVFSIESGVSLLIDRAEFNVPSELQWLYETPMWRKAVCGSSRSPIQWIL